MSFLYKDEKDVKTSVVVKQNDEFIEFDFSADCGKYGTDENLAGYKFTVKRLLEIFSNINVTDDELTY